MEPEISLSCSQEPVSSPWPEAQDSNLHPLTLFPKINFNTLFVRV
jgi:hypothetical protein